MLTQVYMDRAVQFMGGIDESLKAQLIAAFERFFASSRRREDVVVAGVRIRLTKYKGTVRAVARGRA